MDDKISHMQDDKNINFNSLTKELCMKHTSKSRMSTPLCRLAPLSLVRPNLQVEVLLLENEFVNGYMGD